MRQVDNVTLALVPDVTFQVMMGQIYDFAYSSCLSTILSAHFIITE